MKFKWLYLCLIFGFILSGCGSSSDDWGTGSSSTTTLSEGEWADGSISSGGKDKDGNLMKSKTKKYEMTVTKGKRYFIWLNDSSDGDKTKSADIGLHISHSDGTTICSNYDAATNLYTRPFMFTASSSGTVTIKAAAKYSSYWEYGSGSFAIKYTSQEENNDLTEGVWQDAKISATGQLNKHSITVEGKKRYFIYLNDSGDGDRSKTADVGLKISHSDGTIICSNYDAVNNRYTYPFTFVASSDGTVTITAAARRDYYGWEQGIGTYAIAYTESGGDSGGQ